MTTIHPETLQSDGMQPRTGRGGVLRLAIGAAALAVLIALGAQDNGRTASSLLTGPEPAPAAVYDGRGKWAGY